MFYLNDKLIEQVKREIAEANSADYRTQADVHRLKLFIQEVVLDMYRESLRKQIIESYKHIKALAATPKYKREDVCARIERLRKESKMFGSDLENTVEDSNFKFEIGSKVFTSRSVMGYTGEWTVVKRHLAPNMIPVYTLTAPHTALMRIELPEIQLHQK